MSMLLIELLSLSLFIPGILALFICKRAGDEFLPFLILLWVGCCTEVAAIYFNSSGQSNRQVYNLYSLLEPILILWQFRTWGLFRRKRTFLITGTLITTCWVMEMIWVSSSTSSYVSLLYAIIIVLLSINQVNRLILSSDMILTKNPVFIICLGFIIYFTYAAMIELFFRYGFEDSLRVTFYINYILNWVNFLTNLMFAFALIWIPRKQRFILQP